MEPIIHRVLCSTRRTLLGSQKNAISTGKLLIRTPRNVSSIMQPYVFQQRWKRIVRSSPDHERKVCSIIFIGVLIVLHLYVQKKKENEPMTIDAVKSLRQARLIDIDGQNVGVVKSEEILTRASKGAYDIFQVSAEPPVVKFTYHVERKESKKEKSKVGYRCDVCKHCFLTFSSSLKKLESGMSLPNMT